MVLSAATPKLNQTNQEENLIRAAFFVLFLLDVPPLHSSMCRLSENGLHTDLSPEAQGEALCKAMVEAARARSTRGPGDEAADCEEQDEPSESSADTPSLPFLDAPAPARAPPVEMDRAEMERRGLHAQQDEMERLKAESERKIQEFEAQQK